MVDLYDKATNQLIGSIPQADLQVLVNALEEEALDDRETTSTPQPSTSLPMAERPTIS
jgi:hypothetical protein